MTAGDYTIAVVVGTWSVTLDKGDVVDPASDAIAFGPLNVTWSLSAGYPSQPTPTTCSFGLYVPNIVTGPAPVQGTRVEVTITTPDHALAGVEPVLDFVGLVTDVDATPHSDGLAFSIIAADYTAQLGEERIGAEPWPDEDAHDRLDRIIAASDFPLQWPAAEYPQTLFQSAGDNLRLAARDVDSQPTRDLVGELLGRWTMWMGTADPSRTVTGYAGGYIAPSLASWCRPIVTQSVDALGAVTFPIAFIPGSGPDVDAMLPYTVALVGGQLELVRKPITPDSSQVAWVPAAAVEAKSVTWRQDRASNTNRVRATGPDFVAYNLIDHVGALVAEFPDLIDSNGPNEIAVNYDAPNSPSGLAFPLMAVWTMYALLGTHYDASPRWALDAVTIRAEQIPAGDQWPRLFNPREHIEHGHIFDQAVGKFILITDPAPKWNLHDRPDYFGRLAGAALTLAGGRITWTAQLAHRLPVAAGLEMPELLADEGTYTPTHSPITYAELAAGANPTYTQCGDLTPADLELVES